MLSFQEPLALGLEGGGQLLAALSGSWTEVWLELVGSPASATSKAAVSPWPQFRKHLLCSQHLSGGSGSKALSLSLLYGYTRPGTQCRVSWKGLQRPYILQMGKLRSREEAGTHSRPLSKL